MEPNKLHQYAWFVNFNMGMYKTAAYVSTGTEGCTFFCLSSDRSSDLLTEQNIQTNQSGTEKKIGGQVGYKFSDSAIVTLSYQWMDYQGYMESGREHEGSL